MFAEPCFQSGFMWFMRVRSLLRVVLERSLLESPRLHASGTSTVGEGARTPPLHTSCTHV